MTEPTPEIPGGIKTGLKPLDEKLSPLQPGYACVLSSEPGKGKSALALQIVVDAVLEQGKKAALFSTETDAKKQLNRVISRLAPVDGRALREDSLSPGDLQAVKRATAELAEVSGTRLLLEYSPLRVDDLVDRCRGIHRQHGLDLVVVDAIQGLEPVPDRDTTHENPDADQHFSKLKSMAVELGLVLLVVSQQDYDEALMSSRHMVQDADIVLKLIADPDGNQETDKEILIVRQRKGERNVAIPVSFIGHYMRFIPR
jgi:replicative DNA helicase